MLLKGHVTLWVVVPQGKWPTGGTGDNSVFCHLISQDHMSKRSCDFMGGSLSW